MSIYVKRENNGVKCVTGSSRLFSLLEKKKTVLAKDIQTLDVVTVSMDKEKNLVIVETLNQD